MYKKKIAVRAMTAIAAGALLASNVMVAGATGSSVTPTEKAAEETTSELKKNSVDKVENADVSDTPKDETEAGAEEELPQEESKANEDASEEESAADETQAEDDTDDVGETEGESTGEAEETEADDETEEPTEVETAAPEESTGAEDESAAEETEAAVEESQTAVGANAASFALREAKANIGVKVTFKGAYRPGKTTTIVINGATQDAYEAAVDVYLKAAEKKGDIDLGKFAVDYGTLEEKDGKYYATVTLTAKEETPETTTVTINYYDPENKKQAGEVEVETVVDAEGKISQDVVNEKMPGGYTLVSSDYQVRDGYVYVEVKKAATTTVKINYYDAENNKQAAEVEVETVVDAEGKISQDVVNEKMPDGYTLVSSDYQVRDGYVYVEVKKEDKPVVEKKDAVLTISYEDENHVQLKSEKISKNGEVGKSYTFTSADVTLTAPEGYELVTTSFTDTTVDFGASETFVVTVKKTENGGNNNGGSNGGGSSSGGSSGGGGGSSSGVASGSSGTLTNGNWNAVDDGQKWEYNYTNGTKAKNGWYTLEWQDRLDWYYFDADGYLVSGWYTDANGVKYYLHPLHDGRFGYMYTGWNKIDGQWQHFNDNTEQGVYGAWDEGMPVPAELANL